MQMFRTFHDETKLDREKVPCALCGDPTPMVGTRRCARCWELETRIEDNLELAHKIMRRIFRGEPKP